MLFLKTSDIKTRATRKLHRKAIYVRNFPAVSGIPKDVRSNDTVKTVKIAPNKASGIKMFAGISSFVFIVEFYQI